MMDLLTRAEYQAIANDIDPPRGAFIGGGFTAAASGATLKTVNPATGKVLAEISACDGKDVDKAVKRTRKVFESGDWSRMHPSERKKIILRLCKLIRRNRHELAVLESLDSGKPIQDCETIDIPETLHCLEWHAEAADKLYDQISPSGDDALGLIVREPIGVVGCVLPWNFPLMMLAWKIGPALASGNSVIVKPAEQTSLTALRVAELAMEAGIPGGVLNVVPGYGETAGQAIGLHPDIDVVSFTGSTEIGRRFLEYSAASNLKRIILECGGKNPCIVLDDAENLDTVAENITLAAFWNAGQNCTANSRLIVHRDIKDALLEKVLDHARQLTVGDPLDPKTRIGAMIDKGQHKKVAGYLKAGKKAGANALLGGDVIKDGKGLFIAPTVFDDVTPKMSIVKEEIFGPVLTVQTVVNVEEAITVANDTPYGLAASLFTSNVRKAHRVARAVKAGTVSVNCYSEGDIATPFGGFKQSGFGGRDNSLQAHDQYCETKTIWIDLGETHLDEELG